LSQNEPLITQENYPEFLDILKKLQNKLKEPIKKKFYLYKTLQKHILPLTNVCFDKKGKRFVNY